MRHRAGVVGMLCAAVLSGAVACRAAPLAAAAERPSETVLVGGTTIGGPLAPGFVSFSFEFRALHQYTGRDAAHVNPVLIALLRGLDPGGGAVLRVGGDSTDQTWWPVRGEIPPGGVNYALTHGWLRVARSLAQAITGRLLLGINLAANRPALAATEARALVAGIGREHLAGLEIGNEPDLYGRFGWFRDRLGHTVRARERSYDLRALTGEFSRWRPALPRVPLAGPALATLAWTGGLGGFLAAEPGVSDVTLHRYPLRGCVTDPTQPNFPSIANLLDPRSSIGLAQSIAPYAPIVHARGAALRIDELNSASCSGKRGLSDTFAAALWLTDTLFSLASVGVDGVNLHTLPRAAYQPFSFSHDAAGWHGSVAPVYYGALLFTRAFPPGARSVPVSDAGGALSAWATEDAAGVLRTTLINKGATPVTVQLQLSGGVGAPLSAQLLSAPSVDATGGVALAGQSFGSSTDTGTLAGTPSTQTVFAGLGGYAVTVAPYSAVLLTR